MKLNLKKGINDILSNDKRSKEIKSKDDLNFQLTLTGNEVESRREVWEKHISVENLLMGVGISGGCIIFSSSEFCVSSGIIKNTNLFRIEDFDRVKVVRGGWISDNIELDGKVIGKFNRHSIDPWNRISTEINSGLKEELRKEKRFRFQKIEKKVELEHQKIKSWKSQITENCQNCGILIEDLTKTEGNKGELKVLSFKFQEFTRLTGIYDEEYDRETFIIKDDEGVKTYNLIKCNLENLTIITSKLSKHIYNILFLKEKLNKLKNLKESQSTVLSELDKDGNGDVDVIEGNDFNLLLKKHQKGIVEIDRTYVQQFVKISGYLKTKEKNIQTIFNLIKDTPNQELLNEYVEVLKDDIHSYNLILFNSLNMIVSLVEDDMITFYEIHEMFDTLNMFDSKHEKDISQKLTNIGDGLKDLMYEIRRMGDQISDSISELSYVTEQSNEQLTDQLSEIDSTLKVGNLINTINTHQNYKNNKNTKNLRR